MSSVLNQTEYEKYKKALMYSLEKKYFRVTYQPIINTAGKGIGLEMLIRWKYEQDWITLLTFVPILEQYRLINYSHEKGTTLPCFRDTSDKKWGQLCQVEGHLLYN